MPSPSASPTQTPPDTAPPIVTGTPDRPPDVDGWYTSRVRIHWSASDEEPSSGLASQPGDTLVVDDGAEQVAFSEELCDTAGNCARGSLLLSIDTTAPAGTLTIAAGARYVRQSLVWLSLSAEDLGAGADRLELSNDGARWRSMWAITTTLWDLADPATGGSPDGGSRTVYARWTDRVGNVSLPVETTILFDPGRVSRLAGADRFATAAAISRATFAPGVRVAYVATAYDFPDALAGSVAAARAGAPILLARPAGLLAPATRTELSRLRPERIVVLGGTGVLSADVARQLDPRIGRAAELPEMPGYFRWGDLDGLPRDADGIVLAEYPWGRAYNPVTISQVAISTYSRWTLTRSDSDWDTFIRHVEWLVEHQTADGLWLYDFEFGGQPVPWWSAMAEGQAISALVRAYRITGDPRYATCAARALETFGRLQDDRGVASIDRGFHWYEEYMPPYSAHALNGFMFAIIGLWEYQTTFGEATSAHLVQQGLATLSHELYRFDTGRWSCYSLPGLDTCHQASVRYHELHIALLRYLFELTRDPCFSRYAARWQAYLDAHEARIA